MGTTTPNASAALDVTSTTKGFLMPRMTTAQRTAIATPAAGLQVYDTTTNTAWYYNGTIWVQGTSATTDNTNDAWVENAGNTVLSIGNVGIGTTSPESKFHIYDNVNSYTPLIIENASSGGHKWGIGSFGTIASLNPGGLGFGDFTSGGWRMYIDGTGNVGIGTTTPNEKLEITGSIKMVDGNQAAGKLMVSDATGKASWTDAATAISSALTGAGADTTADSWVENTGNTVLSSGKVGIGTINPTKNLHLKAPSGSTTIRLEQFDGNARTDWFLSNNIGYLNMYSDVTNEYKPMIISTESLAFGVGANASINALYLKSDGNVGIGNITPTEKLEVTGSIKMVDGNQAAGKLMVSDATGKATWTDAATAISSALTGAGADTTIDAWLESSGNTVISTGNIGIGTTTPGAKLDVRTDVDGRISILNSTDSNTGYVLGKNVSGGSNNVSWQIYNPGSSKDLRFFVDGSGDVLNIANSGNIGVGTNSPQGKFHILDNANSYTTLLVENATTGGHKWAIGSFGTVSSFNSGGLGFGDYTSGGWRMYIDGTGNVGIGTTAPTSKLQVVGLPVHANNAAAIAAGLTTGAFYHAGDGIVRVVF